MAYNTVLFVLAAALMVFKLTEYESFLALQRWRSRLLSKIGVDSRNSERWPIVVLGNFLDMADTQRQVCCFRDSKSPQLSSHIWTLK